MRLCFFGALGIAALLGGAAAAQDILTYSGPDRAQKLIDGARAEREVVLVTGTSGSGKSDRKSTRLNSSH